MKKLPLMRESSSWRPESTNWRPNISQKDLMIKKEIEFNHELKKEISQKDDKIIQLNSLSMENG